MNPDRWDAFVLVPVTPPWAYGFGEPWVFHAGTLHPRACRRDIGPYDLAFHMGLRETMAGVLCASCVHRIHPEFAHVP